MNIPPLGAEARRPAIPAVAIPTPPNPAPSGPVPDPLGEAPSTNDAAPLPDPPGQTPSTDDSEPSAVDGEEARSLRAAEVEQRKRVALAALKAQRGIGAAAQMAGVHPSTLFRWRRRDPRFDAALQAWREQAEKSTRERMLAAGDCAADTLLNACMKGDVRASLMVLKGLAALRPRTLEGGVPLTVRGRKDAPAEKPATATHGRRKIRIDILQQLIEALDLDPQTQEAYRAAFARHRELLGEPAGSPLR